jgi:hypothetical protein
MTTTSGPKGKKSMSGMALMALEASLMMLVAIRIFLMFMQITMR